MTEKSLKRIANEVLKTAQKSPALRKRGPRPPWQIGVALISTARSRTLCQRYLHKPGPTDVLSFPPGPGSNEDSLGDLAICGTVAARQAKELGHSLTWETRVLVVHGVLHLLGFDHERGKKALAQMRAWEKKLLGKKGLIARVK